MSRSEIWITDLVFTEQIFVNIWVNKASFNSGNYKVSHSLHSRLQLLNQNIVRKEQLFLG